MFTEYLLGIKYYSIPFTPLPDLILTTPWLKKEYKIKYVRSQTSVYFTHFDSCDLTF